MEWTWKGMKGTWKGTEATWKESSIMWKGNLQLQLSLLRHFETRNEHLFCPGWSWALLARKKAEWKGSVRKWNKWKDMEGNLKNMTRNETERTRKSTKTKLRTWKEQEMRRK